jgi:hypothetical protein
VAPIDTKSMITNGGTDNTAIRELRDELEDLNRSLKKSTKTGEKLTMALFLLALIQVLIGLFQLMLSFVYPNNPGAREALGVVAVLSSLIILVYFSRRIIGEY